jgi:hypothetical protein
MKRSNGCIVLLGLLSAAALAGCGGSPSAKSSAPPAASGGSTSQVRLQSQLSTFKVLPGAGRSSEDSNSLGTQLILTGMLFQPHASQASGRSQAVCTRTGGGAGEVFQCSIAFLLPQGTIYGDGVASRQGIASGIVAGGTGRYAGERGTFSYRRASGPRVDLTFTVQR